MLPSEDFSATKKVKCGVVMEKGDGGFLLV